MNHKSIKNYAMTRLLLTVLSLMAVACSDDEAGQVNAQPTMNTGKTLVAYYSYTNNCRDIVTTLTSQLQADVLEIQPAEKGLKYEANGYALGTQLLNAIKAAPGDASSYPAIDPVTTAMDGYQNIIVVTPLWWSQMAAPMQTYLFNYGPQMAGKNVGLIVSSASSSIGGVVADFNRLVPDATRMGDALWINNSNRSQRATLVAQWLSKQTFQSATEMKKMAITIGGQTQSVTLADNKATKELVDRLSNGPINVTLNSSGGFEIWGPLGFALTTSNEQMTAQPGDVVLYNGSNICIFYGTNDWSYTRLGHIDALTESQLADFLQAGQTGIGVTLALPASTGISSIRSSKAESAYYSMGGQRVAQPSHGIYIKDGKKLIIDN